MNYAKTLNFINNIPSFRKMHDKLFQDKTVFNKLYFFRNFQLLRWLDDMDIYAAEVDELELGETCSDSDLVLVYKNKK